MPIVRASSVPRVMACPSSRPSLDDGPVVDTAGDDATLGTVVHHALAMHIQDGIPGEECLCRACADYQVDETQARILFYTGARIYRERLSAMTVLDVEGSSEAHLDSDWTLTGHWDMLGELDGDGRMWAVVDWKSGVETSGQWDQIRAYLLLAHNKAMNDGVTVDGYKGVLVWLREGTVEIRDYLPEQVEQFREMLCAALHSNSYSPGEHCTYCPQRDGCFAYNRYIRAAGDAMLPADAPSTEMTPAALASLYPRTRMLKKALDDYEKALRLAIEENGPLPTEGGRVIALEERERASLLPRLDILADHDIPVEDVVDISKSKLLDTVGERAPRGHKGAAKNAILDAFDAADAVVRKPYKALAMKKEVKSDG